MAAGPAVTKGIGRHGTEHPATGGPARRRFTPQESILLRAALGIAMLAAAISIIARIAPLWPTLTPVIAIALFLFGIGGILGAASHAIFRAGLASAPATPVIPETGIDAASAAPISSIDAETEEDIRQLAREISRLSLQNEGLQEEIAVLDRDIIEERKSAEAARQAKSEFLGHMTHELRTPLNAIMGFADMMRSGVFGPLGHEKYREYADDIHASGEELLGLITDILEISQVQAGEVPIERQRINLEKTIDDCLSMLRPRIFSTGIALTELIDDLPTVYADPVAVRQILLHILSNAMKFTPTGGRISIQADVDEAAVTLIIDDTGIGISPEIMEGIDQPFASLDQDSLISGDEGAGLGVGISVSRALARLNGGSLSIESEEGYGTTVRITLPRR